MLIGLCFAGLEVKPGTTVKCDPSDGYILHLSQVYAYSWHTNLLCKSSFFCLQSWSYSWFLHDRLLLGNQRKATMHWCMSKLMIKSWPLVPSHMTSTLKSNLIWSLTKSLSCHTPQKLPVCSSLDTRRSNPVSKMNILCNVQLILLLVIIKTIFMYTLNICFLDLLFCLVPQWILILKKMKVNLAIFTCRNLLRHSSVD